MDKKAQVLGVARLARGLSSQPRCRVARPDQRAARILTRRFTLVDPAGCGPLGRRLTARSELAHPHHPRAGPPHAAPSGILMFFARQLGAWVYGGGTTVQPEPSGGAGAAGCHA